MTVASRMWRAVLVLGVLLILAFGAIAPPERCPSVTSADLRRSSQATVDWFVRNQDTNGAWLYEYRRDDDSTTSEEYNDVRHAGAVMGLYQAAEAGLPGALRSADRGAEWALDRLTERDDWAAVTVDGRTTTGTSALLVAGLDYRRAATGDTRHDDVMRRLGRFLAGQVEPSGAVLAYYDTGRDRPLPGEYSKYYTGEAYWALARLARTFPDEDFGETATRVGAYLATSRDDEEGYWPPIADHWAEYGMAETLPLTSAEIAYARRQAELWGGQARWVQQRFGPWGAVVRGPEFRGGWYGVINEGFTGLWRIARAEPRLADIEGSIGSRAKCIAGLAVQEQASAADAAAARNPARVDGAWFFSDGVTRMDDQQHALAALLRAQAIVEAGDPDSDDDDVPSVWLWALALLLAVNPARAAFGVPRSGRSSREVAWICAVGGAIGGVAVCVFAALGDPLLDALDVSPPAFRTAAGVVAVLAGATDLFRRPPSPEPALPRRRAALVPVALPLVARPALLVMALSAGADQDVLVSLGAMVVGVAVLTALASRVSTDGPDGRALRWAARLVAAGLVAAGVLLTIDGILSV